MKKIISVLLCVAMLAAMLGCTMNKNTSVTYNGITRAESTVSVDGKKTTEIVYTDANGNELDPEIGEQAFKLAKDGDTDALNALLAGSTAASSAEAAASDETTVPVDAQAAANEAAEAEAAAEDGETVYDAQIHIQNKTNSELADLYFVFSTSMTMSVDDMDDDDWEENMLSEVGALAPDEGYVFSVTHTDSSMFRLRFVTSEGVNVTFEDMSLGGAADPTDIYIVLTEDDESWNLDVQ